MVLQGKKDEKKTWSIPSGQREQSESYEACCERETKEETGCTVKAKQLLTVKKHRYLEWGIEAEVHYFVVELLDGTLAVNDPDRLIVQAKWQKPENIAYLNLTYPEDLSTLQGFLMKEEDDF